jgi:hypothetical protein
MNVKEILNGTYDALDSISEIAKCIELGHGDHVALARAIVQLSINQLEGIDYIRSEVTE